MVMAIGTRWGGIFSPSPGAFDRLPAAVFLWIPEGSSSCEFPAERNSRPEQTTAAQAGFPVEDGVILLHHFSALGRTGLQSAVHQTRMQPVVSQRLLYGPRQPQARQ